jgi:hypothetical protein
MGLFDRQRDGVGLQRTGVPGIPGGSSDDEQAIARYRYLLRTAPPEAIEEAHAEAFAKLTPEQRRRVLDELSRELPEQERDAALRMGDSPGQLARVATRAEIRQPGVMERIFGGMRTESAYAGPSMGGLFAGSLLSSMAGAVLGSMIAEHFFSAHPEANQLFADSAHGGDAPAHGFDDQSASWHDDDQLQSNDGTFADDSGLGSDLDMGFGGDTFDV